MKQQFCNSYRIVFDENGNVKPCGREAVSKLISLADSIEPEISHGNLVSSMMNENLIKNLYLKVKGE